MAANKEAMAESWIVFEDVYQDWQWQKILELVSNPPEQPSLSGCVHLGSALDFCFQCLEHVKTI